MDRIPDTAAALFEAPPAAGRKSFLVDNRAMLEAERAQQQSGMDPASFARAVEGGAYYSVATFDGIAAYPAWQFAVPGRRLEALLEIFRQNGCSGWTVEAFLHHDNPKRMSAKTALAGDDENAVSAVLKAARIFASHPVSNMPFYLPSAPSSGMIAQVTVAAK